MALKKSQLYRSLWESCDELRGGMDASQYKDYVLTLLFMKYVSDKYAGQPDALIEVPPGGGFADMVKLKGDKEIGDKINKIVGRLAGANELKGVIDQADFNDESKLGGSKEMQDRLSKLVAIFDGLDFRANRAGGDDLLGDAYEYLMRNFATESGKSKGQFYTPAEVSRIMAQLVGIDSETRQDETIYDPTCGSGSLLLKAADQTQYGISIYGQEMDNATWALARMNMILHGHPTAELWYGNTLANPYFKNKDGDLKTFDFAVANPPFSFKSWSNGLDPANDEFGRFEYGIPPTRNGDYAFMLHLIASLKSKGKGAIVMPHGVLFRGNREADIRRTLIQLGLIKGIIGLPANLFYGTGIPACIVVIDKENAHARSGIFMIDAREGYIKDGNKNRLREQDIRKIVEVFTGQVEEPRYSRIVSVSEIADPANDFNLNLPRYIDTSEPEDLHDLDGHLNGGIPERDIDDLKTYWDVFPTMRKALFEDNGRPGYREARVEPSQVKSTILQHREFKAHADRVGEVFDAWRQTHEARLMGLSKETRPKDVINALSEDLLQHFAGLPLLDRYDAYQRLMDYWDRVMQDDVYIIAAEGWSAGHTLRQAYEYETADFTTKQGRKTIKLVGELIPAQLLIERFFADEQAEVDRLEAEVQSAAERKEGFEEEHSGDEGELDGLEGQRGVTKGNVQDRVMELKDAALSMLEQGTPRFKQAQSITKTNFGTQEWTHGVEDDEGIFAELDVLYDYLHLDADESNKKKAHKELEKALLKKVRAMYPELSEAEIKGLVVKDKWFASLRTAIDDEIEWLSQQLAGRVKELEERYDRPLPELEQEVEAISEKVEVHLEKMGLVWG